MVFFINYFKSKPVNIPKITVLLDNGYHPEKLTTELKKVYPAIMTKIRFELSPKPSKSQKKQRENQDLSQLKRGGSSKGQIPGWKGVRVWSKILNAL
jgi:hypothetical protein